MTESPQTIKDMVTGSPLLQQITLIYYRFSRGEQDSVLADYVLEQVRKLDIVKYYEQRLYEEHGITKEELELELDGLHKRMEEAGYDDRDEYLLDKDDPFPIPIEDAEEIENIDDSIGELDYPIGQRFTFQRKLEAIDRLMHNYHAGIAPLEIVGVSRRELFRLAEFLKHASSEQLGYVVDFEPETVLPGRRPGRSATTRPPRRDAKSVRVRSHRRGYRAT